MQKMWFFVISFVQQHVEGLQGLLTVFRSSHAVQNACYFFLEFDSKFEIGLFLDRKLCKFLDLGQVND